MNKEEKSKINKSINFGINLYDTIIPEIVETQQSLCKIILEMEKKDKGVTRSNHGGWHSEINQYNSEIPEIKLLAQQIYMQATKCIYRVENQKNKKAKMTALWFNVNRQGNWNVPHIHPESDWSGVLYLSVNQTKQKRKNVNDGDLVIFNPLPLGPQFNRRPTLGIQPQVGKLIIFPSYLLHMVAPHQEKTPRISASFNFSMEKIKIKN